MLSKDATSMVTPKKIINSHFIFFENLDVILKIEQTITVHTHKGQRDITWPDQTYSKNQNRLSNYQISSRGIDLCALLSKSLSHLVNRLLTD